MEKHRHSSDSSAVIGAFLDKLHGFNKKAAIN
jgi:hypothetical protein